MTTMITFGSSSSRGKRPYQRIVRLISGGQTGADRAALDAAIEAGVEYGGWCPTGGWAEDLPSPPGLLAHYPKLREAPSADRAVRTTLNVRDSDATLIIRIGTADSPGTDLTSSVAEDLGRPYLITRGDPRGVEAWLETVAPSQNPAMAGFCADDPEGGAQFSRHGGEVPPRGITLNVAGPRESEQPGLYRATVELLRCVLRPGT